MENVYKRLQSFIWRYFYCTFLRLCLGIDSNVQPGVGKFGCIWLEWFALGQGIWLQIFEKSQIPTLCPASPSAGITLIGALRSSNCSLLFYFSSASFIRQLSRWYKSVVREDCNFSNFGTEAFLLSCYLRHRFCTRCLTGEIHSAVMTKIQWSWHFFGADHRKVPNHPQNA